MVLLKPVIGTILGKDRMHGTSSFSVQPFFEDHEPEDITQISDHQLSRFISESNYAGSHMMRNQKTQDRLGQHPWTDSLDND